MRRLLLFPLLALTLAAASLPKASKPEDLGLSSERLQRIHQMIQRHIDAGDITGAVTLVARHGQLAWVDAAGIMDLDTTLQARQLRGNSTPDRSRFRRLLGRDSFPDQGSARYFGGCRRTRR